MKEEGEEPPYDEDGCEEKKCNCHRCTHPVDNSTNDEDEVTTDPAFFVGLGLNEYPDDVKAPKKPINWDDSEIGKRVKRLMEGGYFQGSGLSFIPLDGLNSYTTLGHRWTSVKLK